MFSSAEEVFSYVKENGVEFVDVRFMDLPGVMQHFNIPASALDASVFEDGLMFDGSSIRGFQAIHESDMKLIPDIGTAFVDPFRAEKTLVINFSVRDPFTDEPYSRDPRNVAAKAEAAPAPRPRSDTVASIQRELSRRGFYEGVSDGVYGPKTDAAVRDFEQAAGLRPSAEPNELLLAAIEFWRQRGGRVTTTSPPCSAARWSPGWERC